MTDACTVCDQRPIRYPGPGECSVCYSRRYYHQKKASLGSGRARTPTEWFDWVAVNRAWSRWQGIAEPPVGRPLSNAERLHLCYHAVAQGETTPYSLRLLMGVEDRTAVKIRDQLLSGAVQVYERDELGRALEPMPSL